MDQSSFISNSSQHKRKPIFNKNDNSPVSKLLDNVSKSSSNFQLNNRNISPNNNTHSHLKAHHPNNMNLSVNSNTIRPQSSYSQPKFITQQNNNPHIVYHQRPATPQMIVQNVIPQKVVHYNPQPTQQIRPQSYQIQKIPSTTLKRSYQPKHQNFFKVERPLNHQIKQNIRTTYEEPELISVERVSKEIGSSNVDKQITYLQNPNRDTYFSSDSHSSPLGRGGKHNEINKLEEINSLLSQNYNLLYNQFFNLKKDIREEDVVEQQAFLRTSFNQIQYIFNMETNQALHQIQELHKRKRYPMKKIDNFI